MLNKTNVRYAGKHYVAGYPGVINKGLEYEDAPVRTWPGYVLMLALLAVAVKVCIMVAPYL